MKKVTVVLFLTVLCFSLSGCYLEIRPSSSGKTVTDTSMRDESPNNSAAFSTESQAATEATKASSIETQAETGATNSPTAAPILPDTETVSQKNAIRKAKSYLNYSAFSYQGLVKQLEYEKFSNADAVYAAEKCGANWNEQSLKKAKSYLQYSAFSYQGLIEQLEFEKFTNSEAVYGANNCGADWNEQAAKKAASYLEYSGFSRDGLIRQLEFEGFTNEQAVYGVDANGL